jgi:hypothetical protein
MSKTQTADRPGVTSEWRSHVFETMPIQKVNQPGCYVDQLYGNLYRITPEMLNVGGTVFHGFVSRDSWNVTKISDDYALALDEARIIAANASLYINF